MKTKILLTTIATLTLASYAKAQSWSYYTSTSALYELGNRVGNVEKAIRPLRGLDVKLNDFLKIFEANFGARGEKYQAELAGLKASDASQLANLSGIKAAQVANDAAIVSLSASQTSIRNDLTDRGNRLATQEAKIAAIDSVATGLVTKVNEIDGTLSRQVTKLNAVDTTLANQVTKLNAMDSTLSNQVTKLNSADTTLSNQVTKANAMDTTLTNQVNKINAIDSTLSRQITKLNDMDTTATNLLNRVVALENRARQAGLLSSGENKEEVIPSSAPAQPNVPSRRNFVIP
jgi:chromosome segregation ATPase